MQLFCKVIGLLFVFFYFFSGVFRLFLWLFHHIVFIYLLCHDIDFSFKVSDFNSFSSCLLSGVRCVLSWSHCFCFQFCSSRCFALCLVSGADCVISSICCFNFLHSPSRCFTTFVCALGSLVLLPFVGFLCFLSPCEGWHMTPGSIGYIGVWFFLSWNLFCLLGFTSGFQLGCQIPWGLLNPRLIATSDS